jgi:Helix-turn-helix
LIMAKVIERKLVEDLPYAMRFSDGRTLAIEIPGRMVVRDRSGEPAFTPEGIRFLDRLRALFAPLDRAPSPGFLLRLREALGLTQSDFGKRIGVNKLTVSRWERGELRPGAKSIARVRQLRATATRRGASLAG